MMRYSRDLLVLAVIIGLLNSACQTVYAPGAEGPITQEQKIDLELSIGLPSDIITEAAVAAVDHLRKLGPGASKKDQQAALRRGMIQAEKLAHERGEDFSSDALKKLQDHLREEINKQFSSGLIPNISHAISNNPWLWGALGVVLVGSVTAAAASGGGGGNGVQTGNVNVTVDLKQ